MRVFFVDSETKLCVFQSTVVAPAVVLAEELVPAACSLEVGHHNNREADHMNQGLDHNIQEADLAYNLEAERSY